MKVKIGEHTEVLAPGDSAMTEIGGGHSIENRAEETAKVLALIMLQ